jgi:putative transcriptional regulator
MKTQINKVAGYRVMLGLTQRHIATKLGISSQSYSNKENGRTSFNDREKLKLKRIFSEIDSSLTIDDIFF